MRVNQPIYKILVSLSVSLCVTLLSPQSNAEIPNENNQPLGRLFSKPNERSKLNITRQNQKLKTMTAIGEQPAAAMPVELPDPITLQGYVKRSDGAANTLWINGQPVQENSSVDNVKIGKLSQKGFSRKGGSTEGIDVKIPANGKQIRLKAGQMYEPENNKIYEMQVVEKAKRLNLERSGTIGDVDTFSRSALDNNAD